MNQLKNSVTNFIKTKDDKKALEKIKNDKCIIDLDKKDQNTNKKRGKKD